MDMKELSRGVLTTIRGIPGITEEKPLTAFGLRAVIRTWRLFNTKQSDINLKMSFGLTAETFATIRQGDILKYLNM